MKPPPNNSLDCLLRAARRRWIFRRAMEAAAFGASIACSAGLLLIAILWWQAESSINLIGALIACGALLGAAMSLIARPSAMQTAKRLDEHHKLHDLLATAKYLIESKRTDEFQNEIIRNANIVASELRLAPMMFARLSAPQKTAMAGLVGLTLTFAAIASSHVERNAKPAAEGRQLTQSALTAPRKKELFEKGTTQSQQLSPVTEGSHSQASSDDPSKVNSVGNAVTRSESRDGNAFAQSDASQPPISPSPASSSSGEDRGIASTGGATGNAGSDQARPGGAANTGANAAPVDLSPRARDAALKLLNNGDVPDAYRDLVRDYFLRD